MASHGWQLALIAGLVLINAAFSGSEMALVSLRDGQLQRLAHASAGTPSSSSSAPADAEASPVCSSARSAKPSCTTPPAPSRSSPQPPPTSRWRTQVKP